MPAIELSENELINALHKLSPDRWPEVLQFIESINHAENSGPFVRTADDLLKSKIVGAWADREDITDSPTFARQLRRQAENRS